MKSKSTLIMGGVFVLLVAVFLVTSYKPREKSKGATPLFTDVVKPVIDKLEINSTKNGIVVLEKRNSIWYITSPFEYKASNVAVEQTITGMLGISVDGQISSRPEAREKFEVSDLKGISLKAYSSGNCVLDAIIGKHTVDLTHTYARLRDSNDINIWRGLFARQLDKDADEWRDKNIYSFNADDIMNIKVTKGKEIRELALSDTTWVYTESGKEKPVEVSKVKQFVNLIATMSCDTFASEDDIPRAAGKEPDTLVSFTVRNGDTHSFHVWTPGEEDNNRYLVREIDGEVLFRFYNYRGSQLVMDYEKLKPDDEG